MCGTRPRPRPPVAGAGSQGARQLRELAKQNSQDEGSAKSGGDLDFFARRHGQGVRGRCRLRDEAGRFLISLKRISASTSSSSPAIRGGDKQSPSRPCVPKSKPKCASNWRSAATQRRPSNLAIWSTSNPTACSRWRDKLKLQVQTATVLKQPAAGASGPWHRQSCWTPCLARTHCATSAIPKPLNGAQAMVSARVVQHLPPACRPLPRFRPKFATLDPQGGAGAGSQARPGTAPRSSPAPLRKGCRPPSSFRALHRRT